MQKNVPTFLISCFALSAALSFVQSAAIALDHARHPAKAPLHSLTEQFLPLKNVFKNVPRAGYYTDKNIEILQVVAQFEQAQYILAPTVLELNNTDLPLVIFDCSSPQAALAKIQQLRLAPVSASNSGLILAVNPKFRP